MTNSELMRMDLSGWPLPDEYLVELGRVSARWASLEATLMLVLGKLAGFNDTENPTPFILVAHASFPQRLDMIGSLCEQLVGQHQNLTGYDTVLVKLRAAQKSRNRFLHNGITLNPTDGRAELALDSARGKLKINIERVEVADIRRAEVEIHDAQRALVKLVFGTEIPSKFSAT